MATRLYGIEPNKNNTDVIEAVGPTATSATIAVVVNLSTAVVEGGGTRAVSRNEVILGLKNIMEAMIRGNWPPA